MTTRRRVPLASTPRTRRVGLARLLVLCAPLALPLACAPLTDPILSEFTIRVDSMSGPTAVSGGAAFTVKFWGTVGPNSCYHFKRFGTTRSGNRLDVTVIGEHTQGDVACFQALTFLRGQPLVVEPVIPDPFTIVAHQPDGSTLTRLIRSE